MVQSRALTDRHHKVVSRVKAAATGRFTITHENRPVGDTNLRPDLVLVRGKEALITDICCRIENRRAALEEDRQQKIHKYEPVRQFLLRREADMTLLTRRMPAPGELSLAASTEDEVAAQLRRCENTAPGGDQLTCHHWRTVDPKKASWRLSSTAACGISEFLLAGGRPAHCSSTRKVRRGTPQTGAPYPLVARLPNCMLDAWHPGCR
ncbi:unnamed protein product, partial [Ixodes persulcatus]